MGQYYKIVNLDKKQFLHPHKFGDGLKLLEFGGSGEGTMLGLAVLLANSNGRGSGDLHSDNPIIGSWAGDRIVVAGDYAEVTDKGEEVLAPELHHITLYLQAEEEANYGWEDISWKVLSALADAPHLQKQLRESILNSPLRNVVPPELKAKLMGESPAV